MLIQEHYPERLAKCYVLHAPYIFWGLWKILTAFMDPTVKEKVRGSALGTYMMPCTNNPHAV
jgi:hypothetical protein